MFACLLVCVFDVHVLYMRPPLRRIVLPQPALPHLPLSLRQSVNTRPCQRLDDPCVEVNASAGVFRIEFPTCQKPLSIHQKSTYAHVSMRFQLNLFFLFCHENLKTSSNISSATIHPLIQPIAVGFAFCCLLHAVVGFNASIGHQRGVRLHPRNR